MSWELVLAIIGITGTVAFGIIAIVLTRKYARKKKPVWARETLRIIGLGSNAPRELKLSFNDKPITDAYQTTLVFFNRGNEAIRPGDVIKNVTMLFRGAEILREPTVRSWSKKEIEFSAKQVIGDGQNAIELGFLYLGHNDGAVIEVIHTKANSIDPLGDIVDTPILETKEYIPSQKRPQILAPLITWILIIGYFISMPIRILLGVGLSDNDLAASLLAVFIGGVILSPNVREHIRYRQFPKWSRSFWFSTEAIEGLEGYCVRCRAKVVMKNPENIVMANGKPAIAGVCPNCNTKVFKIGLTKLH